MTTMEDRMLRLERVNARLIARIEALEGQAERRQRGIRDELRVKRLYIVDDAGRTRITAEVIPEGIAGIWWKDSDGPERISLVAYDREMAVGSVNDREGTPRISASVGDLAFIDFADPGGGSRLCVGTGFPGTPQAPVVQWFDEDEIGHRTILRKDLQPPTDTFRDITS